jgi:predicted pyridoxine 5'-phosphate oxidase superfamily flavin-nucleotide-binding protein
MVKLNEAMKVAFATIKIFPFSTASKDGIPNVIPIGMCFLQEDDETIWVVDNFFNKTLANIKENPIGAIYVWGPESKGCFQIKGDIEIITSGDEYDTMYKMVKAKGDMFPARSLMKMAITEVFECKGGPGAGDKLL